MNRLCIHRPYATLDAFLTGDAWTVGRTDMLLVGADAAPALASVAFDIVLTTGEVVVSGEGRVVSWSPEAGGREGGLRVRFHKLDAASKAVLRRALEAQRRKGASDDDTQPAATPTTIVDTSQARPADGPGPGAAKPVEHASGVRHRTPGPVAAPEDREALLSRLRARQRPGRATG